MNIFWKLVIVGKILFLPTICCAHVGAYRIRPIESPPQEARIAVHDPVMIKHANKYYIFATGVGINVWSSTDMQSWTREKPVFDTPPSWAVNIMAAYALSDPTIKPFRGHIWAPDISFHNGLYYLYYSVSAFGKNTSCMGVATNTTLDPTDPNFQWVDHGPVICSRPGVENWNAIDPNLLFGEDDAPYLIWGSFWDGLQIVRLTDDLKRVHPDCKPTTIASRKTRENPIEAPFVIRKGKYFYLFASIDFCCKGVNSTYKMIYGRSENILGPYIDKEGKSLLDGGGTILMAGDENWHGVGHNAVATFDGKDYLIFHAYDANDNGRSKLRIFELLWNDDDMPVVGNAIY